MLTGGTGHPFEEASLVLAKILREENIESDVHIDVDDAVDALATGEYTMFTNYALRWPMMNHEKYEPFRREWSYSIPQTHRKTISDFVENGGSLLALHTACICFDDWPEWGNITGGNWVWDTSFHPPLGRVNAVSDNIPFDGSSTSFSVRDELYQKVNIRADSQLFLRGYIDDMFDQHPLAWTTSYGRGRVVCNMLGHDAASLMEPEHKRLLKLAARWLTSTNKRSQA